MATVTWHDALDADPPGASLRRTVAASAIDAGTRVWAAGDAAAVQSLRELHDLLDEFLIGLFHR